MAQRSNDEVKLYSPQASPGTPLHKQVIAGAGAGLVEVLIMYPLDVVKTRMQLQKPGFANKYKTIMGTFRTIIAEEGFANLYRGILAPIFAEAPKRAIKFASNEIFKPIFTDARGKISNSGASAAGALAGATEAFINCPFEVVKVRMIAPDALKLYSSVPDATMKIAAQEGFFALYKGFEAQLWRNALWNGAYFGTINYMKGILPTPTDRKSEMTRNFIAGFFAGSFATTLNTPLDVVKSRLQNTRTGQLSWAFPKLIELFREEGIRGAYRGYVPRIVRLGPGGGIMLLAFDLISSLI